MYKLYFHPPQVTNQRETVDLRPFKTPKRDVQPRNRLLKWKPLTPGRALDRRSDSDVRIQDLIPKREVQILTRSYSILKQRVRGRADAFNAKSGARPKQKCLLMSFHRRVLVRVIRRLYEKDIAALAGTCRTAQFVSHSSEYTASRRKRKKLMPAHPGPPSRGRTPIISATLEVISLSVTLLDPWPMHDFSLTCEGYNSAFINHMLSITHQSLNQFELPPAPFMRILLATSHRELDRHLQIPPMIHVVHLYPHYEDLYDHDYMIVGGESYCNDSFHRAFAHSEDLYAKKPVDEMETSSQEESVEVYEADSE
ncbi:hypothetical protein B0H16DRAFT_1465201 [Mycena metata]|uniref:F-box domain-containing protein n=1 Tax=Mycena metata TaxID=1033252 RepID=A0AAD7MDM9_9AGAR|nr:hypothetical protein B0H16DRAFT_1479406 [Mycena metata]KAJ7739546.1 hypothetical protein B0H16DRAFT_1465201 [Mycena metata]